MHFSRILYQNRWKHRSTIRCDIDFWLLICSVNSFIVLIMLSRFYKEKIKVCQSEWTGTL